MALTLADSTANTSDARAQYHRTYSPDALTPVARGPHDGNYWFVLLAGGNPDLEPETAKTYSFGVDFNTSSAFSMNLTFWNINYTNVVDIPLPGGFSNPILEDRFVNYDPTPAEIDAAIALMPAIWGTPFAYEDTDYIADFRRINLGAKEVTGIDSSFAYYMPETSIGLFAFRLDTTYFIDSKTQAAPGASFVNNLKRGETYLRSRASASWSKGPWAGNLYVNYISSFQNIGVNPVENIDPWLTLDAGISYDLGDLLSIERAQIQFDVKNLLDEDPPYISSPPGYDRLHASPIGRFARLVLRFTF